MANGPLAADKRQLEDRHETLIGWLRDCPDDPLLVTDVKTVILEFQRAHQLLRLLYKGSLARKASKMYQFVVFLALVKDPVGPVPT